MPNDDLLEEALANQEKAQERAEIIIAILDPEDIESFADLYTKLGASLGTSSGVTNFGEKNPEILKAARDQAVRIIEVLDPEHITSFADLNAKLRDGLEHAKKMEHIQRLEFAAPPEEKKKSCHEEGEDQFCPKGYPKNDKRCKGCPDWF